MGKPSMTHSTAIASPVVLDVSAVLAASTSSTTPPTLSCLASYPADTAPLLALIREYMAWLNVDLCGRGLEKELPQFETLFTPPSGLFVLAHVDDANWPGARACWCTTATRPRSSACTCAQPTGA
jgi:hypothetical protein